MNSDLGGSLVTLTKFHILVDWLESSYNDCNMGLYVAECRWVNAGRVVKHKIKSSIGQLTRKTIFAKLDFIEISDHGF